MVGLRKWLLATLPVRVAGASGLRGRAGVRAAEHAGIQGASHFTHAYMQQQALRTAAPTGSSPST